MKWFLTICILLISQLTLAEDLIDRSQLVLAADNQLHQIFEYLDDDPKFIAELSAEERMQFKYIYRVISENAMLKVNAFHMQEFGYAPYQEPGVKIKKEPIYIKFSTDENEFKLNPDEPARSAKTTANFSDPIFFNLNILNSAQTEPQYLEMFSLLIHEYGHKLGTYKNQETIDSLAIKIKQNISQYYLETQFVNFKVYGISLPIELKRVGAMGESRPRFPLVIQKEGLIEFNYVDVGMMNVDFRNFRPIAGNTDEKISFRVTRLEPYEEYKKLTLDQTATMLSTGVKMSTQVKNEIVFTNPNVSLKPSPANGNLLIPVYQYIPLLEEPRFTTIINDARMGVPHSSDRHVNPQTIPLFSHIKVGSEGKDLTFKNQILSVRTEAAEIKLTLKKPFAYEKVNFLLESLDLSKAEVEIQARKTFENDQVVELTISEPYKKSFALKRLIIPDVGYIFLPKAYSKIDKTPVQASEPPFLKLVEIFKDGKWKEFSPDKVSTFDQGKFDQDEVRFRVTIQATAPIAQIKLLWTVGKNIYLDIPDQTYGEIGLSASENIKNFTTTQTPDGLTVMEFSSQPQFLDAEIKGSADGVKTLDSGHRFLRGLRIGQTNWQYSLFNYRSSLSQFPYTGEGFKLSDRLRNLPKPVRLKCSTLWD